MFSSIPKERTFVKFSGFSQYSPFTSTKGKLPKKIGKNDLETISQSSKENNNIYTSKCTNQVDLESCHKKRHF